MPENKKSGKIGWFWPLGVLAAGVTGVAALAVRGCWHGKMSWPVRAHRHSYQVCTACGIKRLFDERTFQGFGPYSYDLDELIAADEAAEEKSARREAARTRTSGAPDLIHRKEKSIV